MVASPCMTVTAWAASHPNGCWVYAGGLGWCQERFWRSNAPGMPAGNQTIRAVLLVEQLLSETSYRDILLLVSGVAWWAKKKESLGHAEANSKTDGLPVVFDFS